MDVDPKPSTCESTKTLPESNRTIHSTCTSIRKTYRIIWPVKGGILENGRTLRSENFPQNLNSGAYVKFSSTDRFYLQISIQYPPYGYCSLKFSLYKCGEEDVLINGDLLKVHNPKLILYNDDKEEEHVLSHQCHLDYLKNKYIKDGVFKVGCLVYESREKVLDLLPSHVESKLQILEDLDLRSSEDYSVVMVTSSEGQSFRAHKAILSARCPLLKEKLASSSGREVISLPFDSMTVEGILQYIYRGACLPSHLNVKVFCAATDCRLPRLQQMAEDHIMENICKDNVLVYLRDAVSHNMPSIEQACLQHIKRNNLSRTMIETDNWAVLDDLLKLQIFTKLTKLSID